MIILENIFFGFWAVLGEFFFFFTAFALVVLIFMTMFDLMIPR
jgi:hypothetical protein